MENFAGEVFPRKDLCICKLEWLEEILREATGYLDVNKCPIFSFFVLR